MNKAKVVERGKILVVYQYLEGGTNPKEMGFMARTMVKLATKKPLAHVDNTNRNNIVPIIKVIEEYK